MKKTKQIKKQKKTKTIWNTFPVLGTCTVLETSSLFRLVVLITGLNCSSALNTDRMYTFQRLQLLSSSLALSACKGWGDFECLDAPLRILLQVVLVFSLAQLVLVSVHFRHPGLIARIVIIFLQPTHEACLSTAANVLFPAPVL